MYFRNRTKKFTEDCFSSENIQGLRLALEEADAVIIGAGARGIMVSGNAACPAMGRPVTTRRPSVRC